MTTEIEAKFLNIDVETMRAQLRQAGGRLDTPMRLMRRAIIDYADRRLQRQRNAFVRVRDEGDRVTLTYKQFDGLAIDGAKELETVVGSFDETVAIFKAAGLTVHSLQESKRESWQLADAAVMIDEWPWLQPYLEIEAGSQAAVQAAAERLGLAWGEAVFGDVMAAYQRQYPMLPQDATVGTLPMVRFDMACPELFVSGSEPADA